MDFALAYTRFALDGADEGRPPLVMAHGLLGQGRNFGTLARGFAERRAVYTVDMRNHGDSPWSPRMDYAAMAADLAAFVDEHCGGRAAVLGHSMGGKAAMRLALESPGKVSALVVADMAPVAYDHDYHAQLDAMRSIGLEGIRRRNQADEILAARIPERQMRAFLLQNLRVSPEGASWKANLDALAEHMAAITGWVAPPEGDAYDGPTLFLSGADSDYVRSEHELEIRYLFPKARFESLADAGHWLHAEQPKAFHAAVERFLSGVEEG